MPPRPSSPAAAQRFAREVLLLVPLEGVRRELGLREVADRLEDRRRARRRSAEHRLHRQGSRSPTMYAVSCVIVQTPSVPLVGTMLILAGLPTIYEDDRRRRTVRSPVHRRDTRRRYDRRSARSARDSPPTRGHRCLRSPPPALDDRRAARSRPPRPRPVRCALTPLTAASAADRRRPDHVLRRRRRALAAPDRHVRDRHLRRVRRRDRGRLPGPPASS